MKKYRWLKFVSFLIVLSMILSGCVKTGATTEAPTEATTEEPSVTETEAPTKNTIIIGVTDTIASLDPADAYATHDWELIKNTGEGLLKWKPGTAELQLGLAADWPVISEDGLTYTVTLRDGIKFADGLALTAPMFAEELNRLLTIGPGETCPNAVASALAVPYLEKVEATDDVTIVFTLKAAIGFFSQILATAPYVPAHPDIFTADACNLFPEAPVYGVGPWYITQYTQAEQLVLEPNPYYNGELKAQVDQVIIRYIADPQTLSLAVQNGEIDIAWRFMGPELISGLEEVANLTVSTVDAGPIRYLIVNHTFAPMDDTNVRKAVAAAIDRDQISDVVYSGKAVPLYSMVPPGFLGATEAFETMYASPNLDLAREFLAASGYNAETPLALDLWYPPEHYGAETAAWMEVIKQQLEATGAIEVTLNAQEWSTYITNVVGGQAYTASVLGWFFDYPDSSNYLDPFVFNDGMGTMVSLSAEGSSFGEPINDLAAQLVDLLAQADVETDVAVRADLYKQAQDVYADLVVTVPLFIIAEHVTYNPMISGSASYAAAEALNIGPTLEFNYSTLTKTP
ncbi:MAG: ABC transporter substrate-binding protein [Anaerolineaceae bacterium]|nr:ABC transporter substrate-binding protein [Anaerolineaceae bacterium]